MIYLAGYACLKAEADGKIDRKYLSEVRKRSGMRRADVYTVMLAETARRAAADSPFAGKLPEDTGIIVASEYGPQNTVAAFLDELRTYPEDQVLSTAFSHSVHNAAASYIAISLHITGPELTQTGFENLREEAFSNAEAFLMGGYAPRVMVVFALEHGYITELLNKTRKIPPEYAEAFLLTGFREEGKHGPFSAASQNIGRNYHV